MFLLFYFEFPLYEQPTILFPPFHIFILLHKSYRCLYYIDSITLDAVNCKELFTFDLTTKPSLHLKEEDTSVYIKS